MAELSPASDRAPARPFHAITPEHWEMRMEFKTPCGNDPVQNETCALQEVSSSPALRMSDSFTGFLALDMCETPPGAQIFREQFNDKDDSWNMSFQEETTSREPESLVQHQTVISQDLDDSTSASLGIYRYPEENTACVPGHPEESSDKSFKGELSHTCGKSEAEDEPICEMSEATYKPIVEGSQAANTADINVAGMEEAALSVALSHQSDQGIDEAEEQDNALEVPGEHTTVSDQNNEQRKIVNERDVIHADSECDKSPSWPLQDVLEDCILERLDCQMHQLNNQHTCTMERSKGADLTTDTVLHSGDINTSLMSLGAPQDANELNQLTDFLNMDDPFTSGAAHGTETDVIHEEPHALQAIMENVISSGVSSQRTKRKRKVHDIKSVRRSSIRIAVRESLQSVRSPCKTNNKSAEKVDSTRTCGDTSTMEGVAMLTSGSQISKCSEEIANGNEVAIDSSNQPMTDVETFHHLNIDLPMPTGRKKKAKSTRRMSSRLVQSSVQQYQHVLKEGSNVQPNTLAVEPVDVENSSCDKAFLADFADFGLGDDWMPGEMFAKSQFAKTPKHKSGRRKSARLSGVPIPLLELEDNSKVRITHAARPPSEEMENILHTSENVMPVNIPSGFAIAAPNSLSDIQGSDMEVMNSLPDLLFQEMEPATYSRSRRKREPRTNRRRSMRLAKKSIIEPESESAVSRENQDQSRFSVNDGPTQEYAQLHTLQYIQTLQSGEKSDVTSECELSSASTCTTAANILQDKCMDYEDQHNNEFVDSAEKMDSEEMVRKKRPSRDTPYMGRKRVSRVVEEDDDVKKEADNDKFKAIQDTMYSEVTPENEDKENQSTRQKSGVRTTYSRQKRKASSDSVKIPKKVMEMYLNKGADVKKHKNINLETVFESPYRKDSGIPVKVLGAKKVKRAVVFPETPWLGRPGRTKGRKVKKGKQVEIVLSSKIKRSWKLDVRLSTLDELSP